MSEESLQQKVFSGLFWKFGERIGAQLVSFIVRIVLARLLSPSDFGVIVLITVFIDIANVFVSSGFGSALIQKKEADQLDFSSVFYFSIVMSWIFYAIVFLGAPLVASFYGKDILCPILRVLALKIPLAGVNSVQQAYVQKKMLFKRFFFSTLIGTAGSAVVGIVMAYMGFGPWALVAQYLFNSTDPLVYGKMAPDMGIFRKKNERTVFFWMEDALLGTDPYVLWADSKPYHRKSVHGKRSWFLQSGRKYAAPCRNQYQFVGYFGTFSCHVDETG